MPDAADSSVVEDGRRGAAGLNAVAAIEAGASREHSSDRRRCLELGQTASSLGRRPTRGDSNVVYPPFGWATGGRLALWR